MDDRDIDLEPDDLVARLMPDRDTPPDVVAVVGFLGDGRKGHHRIYANPSLSKWIEVRDDDIVLRERIPTEEGALGGRSVVYVRGEAMRAPLQEPSERLEAEFLAGPQASGLQLPTTLEELAEHLGLISWLMCPFDLRPTFKPPCKD